jgi:GNAT superfamily N-acetyltransferase
MLEGEIAFRPGRKGDGANIYRITLAAVAGISESYYSAHQIKNWFGPRTEAWHEALLSRGNMVVAERGDKALGFVHSLPGEINRLFIVPGETGKGLGKQLLEMGIQHAREGQSGPLFVVSLLNAVPFYEHFGFCVVERGLYWPEVAGGTAELVKLELNPVERPAHTSTK